MKAAAFSKVKLESEIITRLGNAFRLHRKTPAEVISTGILEIDSMLGGLPRGGITEIVGATSSGRTSLMLSALSQATNHQEICALIDTNDSLDPASAATAGVVLDQLLWIRCATKLEHAFKATDLLLQGGGFGLVILDLSDVPPKDTRRIISSWWYRFRRVVENSPTVFVVMTQESCVRSCATLMLQMKRELDLWSSTKEPKTRIAPFTAPFKQAHNGFNQSNPTHANFLRGSQIKVERQKPVQPIPTKIGFTARASS
jgi:recombination protein RecA